MFTRRRRPHHLINPQCAGRQHHQPVEAERNAARLRHLRDRGQKVLVERIGLAVAALLLGHRLHEAPALLIGVGQFAKPVGELDAAGIDLETLGHTWIVGLHARQRRLWRWVFEQNGQTTLPQMGFDMLDQDLAEDVRPGVILADADLARRRLRERGAVTLAARNGRKQVDPGEAHERAGDRQEFGLGKGIGDPAAEGELPDPRRLRRPSDDDDAIGHSGVVRCTRPVPFQHGEFGQMQVAALAISEHPCEFENPGFAGREQLLAGEFRGRPQIARGPAAVGPHDLRPRSVQMGLIPRGDLEDGGFDLDEALLGEKPRRAPVMAPVPEGTAGDRCAGRATRTVNSACPQPLTDRSRREQNAGIQRQNQYVAARNGRRGPI